MTAQRAIAAAAAQEAATARRYSDLCGGADDPAGEVWAHVAELADLVEGLATELDRERLA